MGERRKAIPFEISRSLWIETNSKTFCRTEGRHWLSEAGAITPERGKIIRYYADNRWDENDEFDETAKPKHFNKDTKWSEDPDC